MVYHARLKQKTEGRCCRAEKIKHTRKGGIYCLRILSVISSNLNLLFKTPVSLPGL